jgi:oligopeptide/dipeptide ABC transporter ATP-binding protein
VNLSADRRAAAASETPGEAAPLVTLEDVCVSFHTLRGTLRAVGGVSLDIFRGRTLGIVGESGSGKSVLCRAIMGLLPRRGVRRTGSVCFEGVELTALRATALRRYWATEVGIVFQDPMAALNPVVNIGRQVVEAIRCAHPATSRRDAERGARELLDAVGVADAARRLRQYPHQLSGGMVQRIVIAIALAGEPKLLLADEPTTALDVTVQAQILDLLDELKVQRDLAIVHVTHDLGVIAEHADSVAVMYGGQIVELLPAARLVDRARHPYTRALLASMPTLDDAPDAGVQAIPGQPPDPLALPAGCSFAPRCPRAAPECVTAVPPLEREDTEHAVRCYRPIDVASGDRRS